MKKLLKYIGILPMAFALIFVLASCSNSFYKTFKALGAEIEEDNCFTALTLDEFKAKKEAKEDFVLLLVSSDDTKSANVLSRIQFDVDNQNREATVYVFDVIEGVSHAATTGKEYRDTFGVKALTSTVGFVAVGIQDGKLLFDTSYPNDYCDIFNTTSDAETSESNINAHAVAQYIIENKISNN